MLKISLRNPQDRGMDLLATTYFEQDSTLQYGRRLWIPAHSRLSTWHPVKVPPLEKPEQQLFELRSRLLSTAGTGENAAVNERGTMRFEHALRAAHDEPATVLIALPTASEADPLRADAQDLVLTARPNRGLHRDRVRLKDSLLPPGEELLDGVDHLVIADDRLWPDAAAISAIRRWVVSGGRLWIMAESVSPELLAALLGDQGTVTEVDRVDLTSVAMTAGQAVGKVAFTRELEHPARFVRVIVENIGALADGPNINNLTFDNLKRFQVPLPPLPEQRRIVGILDEAFAGIATAKANAEQNRQNPPALFESHLQAVFTQRGEGWVEKRLGDVANFKNGLNFTRQSNGQTLCMVGVGDFQDHFVVPVETLQFVTIDGKISDDYLIRRDDILTVRSNGSKDLVSRCLLVPDVDGTTSFSGFIICIRFDTRLVSPRFLLHFMRSSATRDRFTRDGGGANISNINQAKLSELPVSLPSFKHQEDIANRLDDLRKETQRLESLFQRKLAALDELKKSLRHRAFRGEL